MDASTKELLSLNQIRPWAEIEDADFKLDVNELSGVVIDQVKEKLGLFGICWIEYHGQSPEETILEFLERQLGPACETQNDYKGKIKKVTPTETGIKNSGDTKDSLGFHVDGTQRKPQPAILVFQFLGVAKHGAESVFLDFSRLLLEIPESERERIVINLSRPDAATFQKRGFKLTAPIFQYFRDKSIGVRWGAPSVMSVHDDCKEDYEFLKSKIGSGNYRRSFLPNEGDIIIFDNWRLLHAREEVGGHRVRQHNRMWIEDLSRLNRGKLQLGMRIFQMDILSAIRKNNEGLY